MATCSPIQDEISIIPIKIRHNRLGEDPTWMDVARLLFQDLKHGGLPVKDPPRGTLVMVSHTTKGMEFAWCDDAPQPTSKSQILDTESAWRTWIWNSLRREAAKKK
jgi:hypothetical protein